MNAHVEPAHEASRDAHRAMQCAAGPASTQPARREAQALDWRGGTALRARRAQLIARLAAHRTAAPLRAAKRRGRDDSTAPPGPPPLHPLLTLAMAAALGGAVVAIRPWRLLRWGVRWMAPVVSIELRAQVWHHLKAAVGAVLRSGARTSDEFSPH